MTGGHAGRQAYTGVPRWLYGLAVLAAVEGTPVDVAAVRPTHPTVTRQPAREQVA